MEKHDADQLIDYAKSVHQPQFGDEIEALRGELRDVFDGVFKLVREHDGREVPIFASAVAAMFSTLPMNKIPMVGLAITYLAENPDVLEKFRLANEG